MKPRMILLLLLGVVVLGSFVYAVSNMGVMTTYQLLAADGGQTSASGTNTISLPYFRKPGLDTAYDLIQETGAQNLSRFIEATDGLETYTGRKGSPSPNFNLQSGETYFIKMGDDVTYVMTGAHNPEYEIQLNAADGGVTSISGTNFFAPPHNMTAETAFGLMNDIGFANVQSISQFVKATDGLETYTGRKGSPSPNFDLVRGEGYFIKMGTTVQYTPSHY